MSSAVEKQPISGNGDWKFWPEVNLSIKLNERIAVLGAGTLHFGSDISDLNEEQAGIGLNVSINRYFSLTPAYRYIKQQPLGRSHVTEHRLFLDFTARVPLAKGLLLSDRNRGEFRRINGVSSNRYRNRLQLERAFKIFRHKVTPYLADEGSYDDRFHIWNRNRLYACARGRLGEHLGVDGYYLEKHDVRDRPYMRRHVLGLILRVEY